MKYRVKFTPTATRQFDRLDAWWKENRDKNPFLFADGVTERKFLGFTFTRAWMGIMRLRPAAISVERMKDRIRELTRPTRGRNLEQIAGDLRRLRISAIVITQIGIVIA